MPDLRLPVSTYRLQFNQYFSFQQALDLVDYFHELGVSDLYASPIMRALPGSLHGYDILDPNQVNPEIGTEEDLGRLIEKLRQCGMGLLLDIVPNHMCMANSTNAWWNDVLENGPSSLYAQHFNIVWNPPKAELKNKVLLPVLENQFGKEIEDQEFKLIYERGAFFIDYKGRLFPVNPSSWLIALEPVSKRLESKWGEGHPAILELQSILTALSHLPDMSETDAEKRKERSREQEIIKKRLAVLLENKELLKELQEELAQLNGVKGDPRSFDELEKLLKTQAYRLSYWRVTNDEINYRRFFDINNLVSMRVEDPEVFDDMHKLLLKWVKDRWVTGFRIDHVDGLFDPRQYFYRLQENCRRALGNQADKTIDRDFYLIVEKILGDNEKLARDWLVSGTTGYEYLNELNGLFVNVENKQKFQRIYEDFIGRRESWQEVIYQCKKLILIVSMSSELHILARHLEEICEQHRWSTDFTLENLRSALRDVISCFPVYRSYIRAYDNQISDEDRACVATAIELAKQVNPASEPSVFDFIRSVLLLKDPEGLDERQIDSRRQFVMRFQQLTGPVMAKGMEDTAFYRHYPLLSLNEVGMAINRFGISIEDFHKKNKDRQNDWPHTLTASSTHDTKRSEDARARLNALSENPDRWNEAINRWKSYNQDKKAELNGKQVPDENEEYLLYQTLIGTWPLYPMDASARIQYINRIDQYMNKALKEAKLHTSWINPNQAYEKETTDFIHKILNQDAENLFVSDFTRYNAPLIRAGLFNALSQILIKITTPGVPDFYQGNELWEFALVDPDNRRPVDYANRRHLLKILKEKALEDKMRLVGQLMENPEDGLIKLYLTFQGLNFRREHKRFFQEADYLPIKVEGEKASHVFAFARLKDEDVVIVLAGRFFASLSNEAMASPIGEAWKGTQALVEPRLSGRYQDVLTGQEWTIDESGRLSISDLFSKLPLALMKKTH